MSEESKNEIKNKEEKPLYSITVKTTLENYTWVVKSIAYTEKASGIFLVMSFLLSGIALLAFVGRKEYILSVFLFTVSFLVLFNKFVVLPKNIKRTFGILSDNNENDNQYDLYEDHIVRINPTGTAVIKYDQINWINEDNRFICFFIPVNKVIIVDKELCDAEAIEFIKSKVDKNKVEKSRKAFKRKSIIIWTFGILIIIFTVFIIWLNKPLNDYPYSTYESFVECLDHGSVDEVTFNEKPLKTKTITYRYVNKESKEYYNTVPPKGYDKDKLLELIEKRDITYQEKR